MVKKQKQVKISELTIAETAFCSFNLALDVDNTSGAAMTISLSDPNNNVVFVPASVTLASGSSGTYHFTVIPVGNYVGNTNLHILLTGATNNGKPCVLGLDMKVPSCFAQTTNKISADNAVTTLPSVLLTPNPATDQVTISYKGLAADTTVTLYDLSSRLLETKTIMATEGSLIMDTSYPAGIYIVVVKSSGNLVTQQKLIIE